MPEKQIISVCQTPLHFIFTLSILSEIKKKAKTTIIWIQESNINTKFIDIIAKHLQAEIIYLKGAEASTIKTTINRIQNLTKLKSLKILKEPADLYYFNDLNPEVQLIAKLVRKTGGTTNLVEDGVAIYDIGGTFKKNHFKLILGKIAYGWWWTKPERIGETRLHNSIFAIRPEQARKSITKNAETNNIIINNNTLSNLFDYSETDPNSVVFLLPFIGNPSRIEEIDKLLQDSFLKFNNKVYLKFHPQERKSTIDRLLNSKNYSEYRILPSDLPVEILFLRSPGKRVVVGFQTSALHVLKSFCSSVEPRYVRQGLSDAWIHFYKEMGIDEHKTK